MRKVIFGKNFTTKLIKEWHFSWQIQATVVKGVFSILSNIYRSSCLQIFFRIGALKNFAIFTGKQLCWRLFLKETPAKVFSCEFCEIVRNSVFIEYLWWLLLYLWWSFLWKLKTFLSFHLYNRKISEFRQKCDKYGDLYLWRFL